MEGRSGRNRGFVVVGSAGETASGAGGPGLGFLVLADRWEKVIYMHIGLGLLIAALALFLFLSSVEGRCQFVAADASRR